MFGLQPSDLIGIAVIALLLFGPARLPELARGVGKGIREFRQAMSKETVKSAQEQEPSPVKEKKPAPPANTAS